jgi:4-amino-4-deoxy-L-arabinose transferase-like glycosyltransferase
VHLKEPTWPSAASALRARLTGLLHPETGPLGSMFNAWFDSEASGLAIPIFCLAFLLVWTCFQVISYATVDLHPDMVEAYAWGLHPSPGYYKHPPLAALAAGAWFLVFPATDWSFHLLAMCNSAVALYATYLIARRYLDADERIVAVLLLLLTPFYQFHGQRFGANPILISTWPIATYCFLRAFDTFDRSTTGVTWAFLAGTSAALAVLGKYYSIFLIAAFLAAALIHPRGRAYLRSWSPWLSAAVGSIVLAPHVFWLFADGFAPFDYALALHGRASLAESLVADARYLAGSIAYVAVLLLVYWLATRPDRRAMREIIWPADPDGRMLVTLLAVPLLLPALVAPLIGAVLTPLWTMPAWFLLPVVLLRPTAVVLRREAAIKVAVTVLVISVAVLFAAPVLAWRNLVAGTKEGRQFYALVAQEVSDQWHARTGKPLTIVMGDPFLALATTFYAADHPDSVPNFVPRTAPWVTRGRLDREGWVAICGADDQTCIGVAQRLAADKPGVTAIPFQTRAQFLGAQGKTGDFLLILVPPEQPNQRRFARRAHLIAA